MQRRTNNHHNGRNNPGQSFGVPFITDEDNRIDWERKQKRKRQEMIYDAFDESDDAFDGESSTEVRKGNRKKRKRKRHQSFDVENWDD